MPPDWDGTELRVQWLGHQFAVRYRLNGEPATIILNGTPLTPNGTAPNAYRKGGPAFDRKSFEALLQDGLNVLEIVA